MRQPREGKLSRSEKNRARRDRVRREKEQKLARIGAELDAKVEAEIRELRRLKMETADDRVEKIRRTADNMKLQLDAKFLEEDWDPSKHDQYIQVSRRMKFCERKCVIRHVTIERFIK